MQKRLSSYIVLYTRGSDAVCGAAKNFSLSLIKSITCQRRLRAQHPPRAVPQPPHHIHIRRDPHKHSRHIEKSCIYISAYTTRSLQHIFKLKTFKKIF